MEIEHIVTTDKNQPPNKIKQMITRTNIREHTYTHTPTARTVDDGI